MADLIEQITSIEKEIRETPYHKGTEHHIGLLRARLARLKDKQIESSAKSKGGGGGLGYAVKKQGDATIVLIGPPSAGKSTLINKLTNANSKVAPYAFTTVSVIPGMLFYKNAYIQILDVPGLIEGAEEGKGRGREVLSVARGADLLVIMTDVDRPKVIENISKALDRNGIRLNLKPPKVRIEKKQGGGVIVHSNIRQDIPKETIKETAWEFGIKNAEITIEEKLTLERLFDAFSLNRVYVPAIFAVNKADKFIKAKKPGYIYISATKDKGIDELKEVIWDYLGLTRVYLINNDQEPNFNNPMIVYKNDTLLTLAKKLGSEFLNDKCAARIWGKNAKFAGQEVSLNTIVKEDMQIKYI